MPGMGIAVATELSSGAISSILEAVPGIATVLRSPVADAIVNLSRSAAGLAPFDPKDAHELIRYAVRRGLIRSDEGDRVAGEIDGVAPTAIDKPAPKAPPVVLKPVAPGHHAVHRPAPHRPFAPKAHAAPSHGSAAKPHAKPHHAAKAKAKPKATHHKPKAKSAAKGKTAKKK